MNSEATTTFERKIFRTLFCIVLSMQSICSDAWIMDKSVASGKNISPNVQPRSFSGFMHSYNGNGRYHSMRLHENLSANTEEGNNENLVKMTELNDMDVVIYSLLDDETLCLGAIQEDGILSPISAWTDEPAFGDSIEFVVDEVDRFSLEKQTRDQIEIENSDSTKDTIIRIHHLLSEDEVSYSMRQCPRGVHNPHGEESENVYYVDQQLIDEFEIDIELKPELETLW